MGKIVAHAQAGCDPTIMGIGPVPAVETVVRKFEKTLELFIMKLLPLLIHLFSLLAKESWMEQR